MSSEKILVSINDELLKKLDKKVDKIGMGATRSGVIAKAVQDFLEAD